MSSRPAKTKEILEEQYYKLSGDRPQKKIKKKHKNWKFKDIVRMRIDNPKTNDIIKMFLN